MFFPSLNAVGGKLAIIGAGGVVLTGGRHQKNFLLRLGSGLASLYNLSGILGDVLSYSRLLALGLATGVIANVINMLAKMTLSFPYGIGYLTMALILLGGHAFNLFIGIMGSYVHTSRLQYVEFFGKFFEGGGRIFSPFKIEQKYTYFKEEMEDAQ
jgi:V/A-type H+-transporting ATPase subunit I